MKNYNCLISIIFLIPLVDGNSQTINPVLHELEWTLDKAHHNAETYDSYFVARDGVQNLMSNVICRTTEVYGNFVKDRFENDDQAIKMQANSVLNFSKNDAYDPIKFFGLYPTFMTNEGDTNPEEVDAMTVSMWVKFDSFLDTERFLLGAKEKESDDDFKFGLSLKGTTLFLKRYYENTDKTAGLPWSYQLIHPGAFDAGFGWYYVSLVMSKTQKYTRVFLGKPNGGASYGPGTNQEIPGDNVVEREFDGRLIWIPGIREGHQNFEYWSIENAEGLTFDEIKIWNKDLSLEEVQILYQNERTNTAYKPSKISYEEKNKELPQNLKEAMTVYPNPNQGNFSVDFKLLTKSPVHYCLYELTGEPVWQSKTRELIPGNHRIGIDLSHLNLSGIFSLKIQSDEFTLFKRVAILSL